MTPETNPAAVRKRLDQKVRTFMEDRHLWPSDGVVLLAVSGGPDSTALLLLLDRLARYRGSDLEVAHFDHGLRSQEEAAQEAAFVVSLCHRLGRQMHVGHGDVRGRAERESLSLEDAARRERYEFLASTARQTGSNRVMTGHTASDQAETVLMHILRGAGMDGLAGMAPAAAWPVPGGEGLTLARPLLSLTREETVEYCAAAEVEPVQDASNDSPAHVRNRVRAELLPLLRTFNPRVDEALVRLADASRNAGMSPQPDEPVLDRSEAEDATPELVRGAIAAATGGDLQGISGRHVAAVQRLLEHGATGDRVDLPRGLRAVATREAVVVEPGKERTPLLPPDALVRLHPEMPSVIGQMWARLGQVTIADADASVEVDAEAAEGVYVRGRREGDRFQPLGMQHTKKLQDFFVDAHVPRDERDDIPIFLTRKGIIWVGGLRIAHWARPRAGHPTVWLSFRRG